jgi:hypothetical protein
MPNKPVTTPTKTMAKPKPGEPWTPTVNVILDAAGHTFHFETIDLPMGPNNELYFHNGGQPGFVITYHLQNAPDGYVFPENLDEALWSVEDAVCPAQETHWPQFKAKGVLNNGHDLVVRNLNPKKQKFGYTLRVTNDGGQSFWNLDPIGGNEDGSTSYQSPMSYGLVAVGGALVGSLVTLGIQAMLAG